LDLDDRRALEIFTRAISLFCNLLATTQGMDRVRRAARSLADSARADGPAKTAALVPGDGRRHVFAGKKRGADVGNTKRGKGTKIMLLVDGCGTPISAMTTTARHAEVSCIETLVDVQVAGPRPKRLLYDKAADADWLRDSLERRGVELICPHRSNRKQPPRQDGRSLRRYRHRWIVERTISWLQNCRRLIIRHEYYPHLFDGFVTLACLLIALKWF
jgi:transposase